MKNILRKIVIFLYQITTFGLKKGAHVTRYFMYQHISRFREPRASDLKVLTISGSQRLGRLLGFENNQITDVRYPQYNILNLPFKDGEFDCVVSDQVLEHVEGNPQDAINETFRVLKPNGIALHATVFIYPIHGCPYDFWRFTPDGLKLLVAKQGDIIDFGGWGNRFVWLFQRLGILEQPIPHSRWHPYHWIATKNDPKWPIVTWVIVRKRTE